MPETDVNFTQQQGQVTPEKSSHPVGRFINGISMFGQPANRGGDFQNLAFGTAVCWSSSKTKGV